MGNDSKKLFVEFLGTCIFFFIGAGAIITNQFSNGAVGLVGIAVDILVGGPLSAASMNPARTFGPGLVAGF